MDSRDTKQGKLILDILKKNKLHPSIQEIYQEVLKIDSRIGQATVYRNINKLVHEGKIRRLRTLDNAYHYDINIKSHYHFVCKKCHKIIDLYEKDGKKTTQRIAKKYKLKIDTKDIIYVGTCEKCCEEFGINSNG